MGEGFDDMLKSLCFLFFFQRETRGLEENIANMRNSMFWMYDMNVPDAVLLVIPLPAAKWLAPQVSRTNSESRPRHIVQEKREWGKGWVDTRADATFHEYIVDVKDLMHNDVTRPERQYGG